MAIARFTLWNFEPRVRITSFCSAHMGIRPVGYFYNGESHDFWEAVFILKGTAGITAGETVYTLSEGQMIFHPPGEFHRLWNNGNEFLRIATVSFGADFFPIDRHRIYTFQSYDRVFESVRAIRRLFKTDGMFIVGIREGTKESEAQKAVTALELLFLDILDQRIDGDELVKKDRLSKLYSKAISVMKADMSVKMSAESIAAECGMSVSTLQKLFCRYTGMGMMKYYEGVRMQYAKTLLDNGYLVKDVAFAIGYNDQNYFSTAYKRYYGVSPADRESGKQKEENNGN